MLTFTGTLSSSFTEALRVNLPTSAHVCQVFLLELHLLLNAAVTQWGLTSQSKPPSFQTENGI